MMQIIDAEYWKSVAALPDGFKRIDEAFSRIMAERDAANEIAAAAARGHSAQLAAGQALKERVDELLAANGDLVTQRQESNAHLRAVIKTLPARNPVADKAAEFLGMAIPSDPAASGIDGEA